MNGRRARPGGRGEGVKERHASRPHPPVTPELHPHLEPRCVLPPLVGGVERVLVPGGQLEWPEGLADPGPCGESLRSEGEAGGRGGLEEKDSGPRRERACDGRVLVIHVVAQAEVEIRGLPESLCSVEPQPELVQRVLRSLDRWTEAVARCRRDLPGPALPEDLGGGELAA